MMFRSVLHRRFQKIFILFVISFVLLRLLVDLSRSNVFVYKNYPSIRFDLLEKIQLERRSLIKESCRDIKLISGKIYDPVRFYIEDRHGLLYCDVPKVYINQRFKYILTID